MRIKALFLLLLTFSLTGSVSAQSAADSTNIRGAALDYIEGWFDGDADRMARALHPELIKRIVITDDVTSDELIDVTGKTQLVAATHRGFGKQIPVGERKSDVTILDVTGDAASVKIDAGPWVDYLHMVRFEGDWKILNVLWERY